MLCYLLNLKQQLVKCLVSTSQSLSHPLAKAGSSSGALTDEARDEDGVTVSEVVRDII